MGAEHFPMPAGDPKEPQLAFDFGKFEEEGPEEIMEEAAERSEELQESEESEKSERSPKKKSPAASSKKKKSGKPAFLKKKKRTPEEEQRFQELKQKYMDIIEKSANPKYEMLRMSDLATKQYMAGLWAENEMEAPRREEERISKELLK